jgi:Protein of unknown function (DUF3383)
MANIDRVVNVQIALRTSAITTLSFSDLLILGMFKPQNGERVIVITDPDELVDDYSVPTGSPLYRAAQVCFSQIPTIPQLFIGNKDPAGLPPNPLSCDVLDPHYMEQGQPDSANVTLKVTGKGFMPTSKIRFGTVVEPTTRFISETELQLNITAPLFPNVDPYIPVTVFDPNMGESNIQVFQIVATGAVAPPVPSPPLPTGDANPADIMAAINGENSDWYAFCDSDHDETKISGYAAWSEASQKLFVCTLSTPESILPPSGNTSVAAELKNGNFFRTAWWYNPDPLEFVDVAITARSFTKYPGGETWANQRLAGVQVTKLGETASRNINAMNGNTFEPFRNINITQYGKVAGGEWIDVIRFRDWLCEEVRTRVFLQMVDNRIPYTDPGIGIIRTRIDQALAFGVARGGIAPPEVDEFDNIIPSYTIDMPLSMSVSFNNKANRLLQDVYFTARLAGAIHVVEIKGTLTYEALAPA